MTMMNTDAPPPNSDALPLNTGAPAESPGPPARSGRLPYLGVLRFTGPDSLSFLQGQVSNDTRRLAENRSMLAAFSSPQGRVLALMHLLPHSGGVIAVLPRELVLPTLEGLRRFVLRAKVKIEDAGELLSVAGVHGSRRLQSAGFAEAADNAERAGGYTEKAGVGVAAVNHDTGRYWVVGAAEKLAEHGLGGEPFQVELIEQDWRLADIRAGLPQIYLPTREAFVAQMLNLDLLDGISFSKGCYTGQEIIARTQHLGRIKRRLYRLQLPLGEWRIGQTLHLRDGRAGRLTEIIRSGGGYEALAVLNVDVNATAVDASATAADGSPRRGSSGDGESADGAPITATGLPLPYEL
jgi:tRNA-modifying protein YgfZ